MAFTDEEQQTIDDLDSRIQNLENLIQDLNSQMDTLTNMTPENGVFGLDQELEDLSSQVSTIDSSLSSNQSQTDTNTNDVSSIESNISSIEDDIIVIESDINTNVDDIQGMQERMAQYENNIEQVVGMAPDAPTNLFITENGDQVELTFDLPDDNVDDYEVWSSIGSSSDFRLRKIIPVADLSTSQSTLTVIDRSYDRVTDINYRIYATNDGNRSSALTGSLTLSDTVADPTNLVLQSDMTKFHLSYNLPSDRRLEEVEVYMDAKTDPANLARGDASQIYSGLSDSIYYYVPDTDLNKDHQFWVESITRN